MRERACLWRERDVNSNVRKCMMILHGMDGLKVQREKETLKKRVAEDKREEEKKEQVRVREQKNQFVCFRLGNCDRVPGTV